MRELYLLRPFDMTFHLHHHSKYTCLSYFRNVQRMVLLAHRARSRHRSRFPPPREATALKDYLNPSSTTSETAASAITILVEDEVRSSN